jgi:hypothetical protein
VISDVPSIGPLALVKPATSNGAMRMASSAGRAQPGPRTTTGARPRAVVRPVRLGRLSDLSVPDARRERPSRSRRRYRCRGRGSSGPHAHRPSRGQVESAGRCEAVKEIGESVSTRKSSPRSSFARSSSRLSRASRHRVTCLPRRGRRATIVFGECDLLVVRVSPPRLKRGDCCGEFRPPDHE